MYGRKDLVKITNLSAILRTIKKCLGTPLASNIQTGKQSTITLQGRYSLCLLFWSLFQWFAEQWKSVLFCRFSDRLGSVLESLLDKCIVLLLANVHYVLYCFDNSISHNIFRIQD